MGTSSRTLRIDVVPLADVKPSRLAQVGRLTKAGSKFNSLIRAELECAGSQSLPGAIAIVQTHGGVAGWARCHEWKTYNTPSRMRALYLAVEAFVGEQHRRNGFCRAAVSALLTSGFARHRAKCIAVFSPEMSAALCGMALSHSVFQRGADGMWCFDRSHEFTKDAS